MKKIEKLIKELNDSPLFHLSLASKELFHSNFLAWFIETFPEQGRSLVKDLTNESFCGTKDELLIQREKDNIDLQVECNGKRLVLENKLKSLPGKEQLERYKSKFTEKENNDKNCFVLLSLTKPSFIIEDCGWRWVSYSKLKDTLDFFLKKEAFKKYSKYHQELVRDYHTFIQSLDELHATVFELFEEEKVLVNPFEWPKNGEISLYAKFKKIRMHDIFEKWRMLKLKESIDKKLGDKSKLDTSVGFTRGLGLLDIAHKKPENYKDRNPFFKIQVQGTQLRQVFECKKPQDKELFKRAKKLLEDKKWFRDKDDNPLEESGKKDNNCFCKYGNGFVYRHEKLESLSRLVDLVNKLNDMDDPFLR